MKKLFLSILLMTIVISSINSQTMEIDGVVYNILFPNDNYMVEVVSNSPSYEGDIVIPAIIEFEGNTYSVTGIGMNAFRGCTGLTSIKIPNSVTSIGNYAFSGCIGLTSFEISNSVRSIGDRAFFECTGLISINIDSENNFYSSIDGVLYNKNKTKLIICPEEKNSIIIPSSVDTIGHDSFWGCNKLSTIEIPNSVKVIDYNAFGYCTGITSIYIPSSVKSIYFSAFALNTNLLEINVDAANNNYASSDGLLYNKHLTTLISCPAGIHDVDIPNSVDTIYMNAFFGQTELSSITIPSSVKVIFDFAFYNCTGLTSIVSNAISPPTVRSTFLSFYNVPKSIPIYVPAESVSAYQVANGWKDFTNILPLETVTDIDGNVYNTVQIGNQVWMQENLKTTRYSDGTAIPLINTTEAWDALSINDAAYCWYDDDINNKNIYGALYTWAAAMNGAEVTDSNSSRVQGACPTGWHIPSWEEWGDLIHTLDTNIFSPYYSGGGIAGGKMKVVGTSNWQSPNAGATNESGFSALPSGGRGESGNFLYIDTAGIWWSGTKWGDNHVRTFMVYYNSIGYSMLSTPLPSGLSIRCLKDTVEASSNLEEGLVAYYPFDGNAQDYSEFHNHGIINGAQLTTGINGYENTAYVFDGINDYIKVAGNFPITNNFTISLWAYSEDDSGYSNLLSDGSSAYGGNDFLINFKGNDIGIRADKNASLNYEDFSPEALQNLNLVNNWSHIVWTMSPTSSTIYVNGEAKITINEKGSNEGYHDDYSFIGARQVWGSPDNFFKGKLDEIKMYNRALSYTEIQSLYALNKPIITSNNIVKKTISIYPNPASEILNIEGLQSKTIGHVYNSNGQMMFSKEIDAQSGHISVSELPFGLYILKMNVGDGVVIKRFAKQ